jgi:hypothetical protein
MTRNAVESPLSEEGKVISSNLNLRKKAAG